MIIEYMPVQKFQSSYASEDELVDICSHGGKLYTIISSKQSFLAEKSTN